MCECVDCEWSLSLYRSLWGSCRQGSVTAADPLCDGTAGMSAKSFTCKSYKYCLYTVSMVHVYVLSIQHNLLTYCNSFLGVPIGSACVCLCACVCQFAFSLLAVQSPFPLATVNVINSRPEACVHALFTPY